MISTSKLRFEIFHHLNPQQFDRLDHGLVVDELEEPVLPSRLLPGGVHEDEEVRQRGPDAGVGEIDELRLHREILLIVEEDYVVCSWATMAQNGMFTETYLVSIITIPIIHHLVSN